MWFKFNPNKITCKLLQLSMQWTRRWIRRSTSGSTGDSTRGSTSATTRDCRYRADRVMLDQIAFSPDLADLYLAGQTNARRNAGARPLVIVCWATNYVFRCPSLLIYDELSCFFSQILRLQILLIQPNAWTGSRMRPAEYSREYSRLAEYSRPDQDHFILFSKQWGTTHWVAPSGCKLLVRSEKLAS